jgi:hypothetical protein
LSTTSAPLLNVTLHSHVPLNIVQMKNDNSLPKRKKKIESYYPNKNRRNLTYWIANRSTSTSSWNVFVFFWFCSCFCASSNPLGHRIYTIMFYSNRSAIALHINLSCCCRHATVKSLSLLAGHQSAIQTNRKKTTTKNTYLWRSILFPSWQSNPSGNM